LRHGLTAVKATSIMCIYVYKPNRSCVDQVAGPPAGQGESGGVRVRSHRGQCESSGLHMQSRQCSAPLPANCWCHHCRDKSGWSDRSRGLARWALAEIPEWRVEALRKSLEAHQGLLLALGRSAGPSAENNLALCRLSARAQRETEDRLVVAELELVELRLAIAASSPSRSRRIPSRP
jgi:hypothetical protein